MMLCANPAPLMISLGLILMSAPLALSAPSESAVTFKPTAIEQQRRALAGELENLGAAPLEQSVALLKQWHSKLTNDPAAAQRVSEFVEQAGRENASAVNLERSLKTLYDFLNFKPTMEAPMPTDFPAPTPIEAVMIKRYPSYRMAMATMDNAQFGNNAFFQLFRHISSNDIPMTAPVQMDFPTKASSGNKIEVARRAESMAFLYEYPEQHPTGTVGQVRILDVEPTMTISTGVRGDSQRTDTTAPRARLEAWLAANQDRYEPAGKFRVMGYNSPMLPNSMKYFEVEIPIRAKQAISKGQETADQSKAASKVATRPAQQD